MLRNPSHQQAPTEQSARLALCYKSYLTQPEVSHVGLGVAARHKAAVLRQAGFRSEVWPLERAGDLAPRLERGQEQAHRRGEHPFTHVVISAPWMPTAELARLCLAHPEVVFAVVCHSNVAFLQSDPRGLNLLRESFELVHAMPNFRAAGNCATYAQWVRRAYGLACECLPNLYDLTTAAAQPTRRPLQSGTLRIGCFGATRPQKNLLTSIAGAMEAGQRLCRDTEVWVNSGRAEGASGKSILDAARALSRGTPRFALREQHWQSWPQFRRTVAGMDLLISMTTTESFNIVSADGIAEGVASVTGQAVDWVPASWHADCDDPSDVADRAVALLHDPYAPQEGRRALERHNAGGVARWREFLLTVT